jgi:serine/threonine protein kinase
MNSMSGEGDAKYKAIEILENEDYSYEPSADIWSLGVVMYEVTSFKEKKMAFQARKTRKSLELLTKFQNDLLHDMNTNCKYSTKLTDLILRMLDTTPHKRPTAKEILEYQIDETARLDQLMNEQQESKNLFLQKQQILRDPKLFCFYEQFQKKLNELSVVLKMEQGTIIIAGHAIELTVRAVIDEKVIEQVARKLVLSYEKQIKRVALDDRSFSASFKKVFHKNEIRVAELSECAVGRIIDGLLENPNNVDAISLVRSVAYAKRNHKMLPDCKIHLEKSANKPWTDRGLFQQTGIEGPNNEKFKNPDTNALYLNKVDVYGYRAGTTEDLLYAMEKSK